MISQLILIANQSRTIWSQFRLFLKNLVGRFIDAMIIFFIQLVYQKDYLIKMILWKEFFNFLAFIFLCQFFISQFDNS